MNDCIKSNMPVSWQRNKKETIHLFHEQRISIWYIIYHITLIFKCENVTYSYLYIYHVTSKFPKHYTVDVLCVRLLKARYGTLYPFLYLLIKNGFRPADAWQSKYYINYVGFFLFFNHPFINIITSYVDIFWII